LQQSVASSITSQQFIAEGTTIALPQPPYAESAKVIVTKNRSFEAARPYAEQGLKTAVLNFASSTNPGGGVTSGASAQEECLCRVSTLYPCLKDESMWDLFYAPHRKARNPLHNDDIIYTKDVIVFKDDDYQPLPKPFTVDVITCAAPTLREQSSNRYNPSDGDKAPDITPEDLLALHEKRGRQILSAAVANGAQVIILGAFGCGAFKNDPAVVAQAYANILPEYLHYFRTIEFAVYCRPHSPQNFDAFKNYIV
jgi:uncharacterized protein (TIGR02452 family)